MKTKPTMGRPKTFEKDEIIKLAMLHFWEHGYNSTNLDELLHSMGIKKSSFYRTFKSKEEIFSLSLDLYRKETFAWLAELQNSIGTKNTLIEMIKMTIHQVEEEGRVKGCLLMNSGKESFLKYPSLEQQIKVEFDSILSFIVELIDKAKEKREITNTLESKKIAMRFLTIYNGIIVMLQAGRSVKEVEESLALVEELLI